MIQLSTIKVEKEILKAGKRFFICKGFLIRYLTNFSAEKLQTRIEYIQNTHRNKTNKLKQNKTKMKQEYFDQQSYFSDMKDR